MTMREDHPDERRLGELRAELRRLDADPTASGEQIEQLAASARALAAHPDPAVAGPAQALELRALSLQLARQAEQMRAAGRRLLRLARRLPAPRPELN